MQRKPISKATAWIALAGTFGAIVVANWLRARGPHERETAVAPATTAQARLELAPWGSGLPRGGQWRHGFDVVDFDGDGELDVVHGPARKAADRKPQIFLGDGEGRFTAQTRYTFPDLPYFYGDVAVADFDGDDALDLAIASHLERIAVLVRRGDRFIPYGELPRELSGFSSRAIEAFDWNADGRMDLIASNDGPRPFETLPGGAQSRRGIAILLGVEGGFEVRLPVSDVEGYGDSLAVGELDRSPGLEILTASNVVGSKNVLYRNTPDGLALGELPGAPEGRVVRAVALAQGRSGTSVLLGGLARGERGLAGSLDVVKPDATSERLFQGEPLRAVSSIGTGDVDADGELDLLIGEENGTLRRFEADGDAYRSREVIGPGRELAGCTVYGIAFANLDRQVGDEVIVSYAGDDGACPSEGGIVAYRLTKR